jgi:hypothetical protein
MIEGKTSGSIETLAVEICEYVHQWQLQEKSDLKVF